MSTEKILIIDDDERFSNSLKNCLEKIMRYEVRTETNGNYALDIARIFQPDLILLDVMMPEMEGGDVASSLKQDDATKDIPIVFMTAAATEEELGGQGSKVSGHYFLAKPITLQDVENCIKRIERIKDE